MSVLGHKDTLVQHLSFLQLLVSKVSLDSQLILIILEQGFDIVLDDQEV